VWLACKLLPQRSGWLFAESSYVSLASVIVAHEQALCIVGVPLGVSGHVGASHAARSAPICIRVGSSVALVASAARVPGLSLVVLGGLGLVVLKSCHFVIPRLSRVQLLLLVGRFLLIIRVYRLLCFQALLEVTLRCVLVYFHCSDALLFPTLVVVHV